MTVSHARAAAVPAMTRTQAFWRGSRDCAPFLIVIVPYSMLFGVVAREAGLDMLQILSMAVLVIAGASQFTAIALLKENVPVFMVIVTALAVNLRMAMYSAALVTHLGRARLGVRALIAYLMVDQSFAVAIRTYEDDPSMPIGVRVAYYFGCMALICPLWYGFSAVGAIVGEALPTELALDFAAPVCFIALLAPLLRTLPHILAAFVSAVGAVAFAWVPWGLGLIVAAGLAIFTGARVEYLLARRGGKPA